MTVRRNFLAVLVMALAASLGCGGGSGPAGVDPPATPPPPGQNASLRQAIVDYRYLACADSDVVALARADLVVLDATTIWSIVPNADLCARLRAANPSIKILAYLPAKNTRVPWAAVDPVREPFGHAWHEALAPYRCWTTAGDTLLDWPNSWVVNILEPECRRRLVDVVASFQESRANKVDGVFWDYFGPTLWISPMVAPTMEGDPDMDGNGIGHFDDPAEMAGFRAASTALLEQMQQELGAGFIQIVNGTRAATDSTFAALTDGMFYELFPTQNFHPGPDMRLALEPTRYNNLFAARHWPRTRNGGPWLILSNPTPCYYFDDQYQRTLLDLDDINRVVALLTGATVSYSSNGQMRYGWPAVDLALGEPLGGVTWDGETISRRFARGSVTATFTSGSFPLPFDFEIVQDGVVVQALDYPRHIP